MEQSQTNPIKKSKKFRRIILLFIIGLAVGAGIMWWLLAGRLNNATVTPRTVNGNDGNVITTDAERSIVSVAEKVSPSVVSIVTNTTVNSIWGAATQEAAGTGMIVSSDGYVMTNKHVVQDASSIQVALADGTLYEAVELVGVDPLNDVAFLKIKDAKDLPAVTLGDSSSVRVGQQVVAIGNSLGQYQNTVTNGIISGKGRPVAAATGNGNSAESLTDLLQTDAAINPGNSGGPLLNMSGQVIGINTAVAANAEGIGFAIPVNATKGMLKSVLANKGAERPYIGLRYVPITAAIAKKYNLTATQGAYVISSGSESAVVAGGPADRAGIKEKDIITKINGLMVGTQGGVSSLIGEYAPGDTVEVSLLRGGREMTVKVTLATYQP